MQLHRPEIQGQLSDV